MEAILAAVDELQDELVALLQRLIRIPTVNPPGEAYEEFVADLRAVLDGYGYATEVHHAPTELAPLGEGLPRPNLIGKLAGDGPLVHLNGHYDVVPVGNDWTRDPFGGELRATAASTAAASADMKSGLAAQIIAVEALRRAGYTPNIHQSAVPDEETVGVRNAGMGWLVEQGLLEGDAVIITEPFGPDGVGIGHKGAIWGEITIFGKQAHGSAPQLGVNAVELMARYLATLDRELRPQLETRITDYGVTPDNQRSTLSFDTIRGGHATNIVPDRCTVTFNRRLIPGEDLDEARRELLAPLDEDQARLSRALQHPADAGERGRAGRPGRATSRQSARPRTPHPHLRGLRRPALRRPQRRHHQLARLRPGPDRPEPHRRRVHLRPGPHPGHEGTRADHRRPDGGQVINHVRGRSSLLWLLVPFLLFVAAIPLANRAEPVILGLPFLFFWALLAVILSPLAIWLAARKDPYYLRDEAERTDVD